MDIRNKTFVVLIAICFAIVGCGSTNASTSSNHLNITDEFVIYGIKIGDSSQTVSQKIGIPIGKYIEKNGDYEYVTYSYPDLEISIAEDQIEAINSCK